MTRNGKRDPNPQTPQNKKPKLVVLTGAGISAESGLQTFRAREGLWHQHRVEDVATHRAWIKNRELVLEFYNERRAEVAAAKPNAGHIALAELEAEFEVTIVTQNIDDLHERAGSTNVIHLHGEILKGQSSHNPSIVVPLSGPRIEIGDRCPKGSQLRPHVVLFEEPILRWNDATEATQAADAFAVIGTSLQIQPAASLCLFTRPHVPLVLIDTNPPKAHGRWHTIALPASAGAPKLKELLKSTQAGS